MILVKDRKRSTICVRSRSRAISYAMPTLKSGPWPNCTYWIEAFHIAGDACNPKVCPEASYECRAQNPRPVFGGETRIRFSGASDQTRESGFTRELYLFALLQEAKKTAPQEFLAKGVDGNVDSLRT